MKRPSRSAFPSRVQTTAAMCGAPPGHQPLDSNRNPIFRVFTSWNSKIRLVWCGGWDLNPRTPTGQGPEPCAFDLSWQPPRERKKECAFDKRLSCFGMGSCREVGHTFDAANGRIFL